MKLASLSLLALCASADPSGDAAAACASLNLTQQLAMMRGFGEIAGYSRNSGCADVCGRATFRWDNGPQGFGDGTIPGTTTQFPSSLAAAATFDPELVEEFGTAMGEEWWLKGTNIFEGPGVNVARIQHNGRNFEYMSGECPVLGSMLLPRLVAGVQKNAMAIVKHYIGTSLSLPLPLPPSPLTLSSSFSPLSSFPFSSFPSPSFSLQVIPKKPTALVLTSWWTRSCSWSSTARPLPPLCKTRRA